MPFVNTLYGPQQLHKEERGVDDDENISVNMAFKKKTGSAESLHSRLFIDEDEAKRVGTVAFPDPVFKIYESSSLSKVDLCNSVKNGLYPRFLPRPFTINSVQSHAVLLALKQYFKHRIWQPNISESELVTASFNKRKARRLRRNLYGGGFIIGDGTGIGKTREIAAFLVSVVLAEREVQARVSNYIHEIPENYKWTTRRHPFFIWLTCSRSLFLDCQRDIKNVLINPDKKSNSWTKRGFPDIPSYHSICESNSRGGNNFGVTTVDHTGASVHIRFITLADVKSDMQKHLSPNRALNFLTVTPTVLFMTYHDLNSNLEFILRFIFGGVPLSEITTGTDTFVTALLCDEFHTPKNISDVFRKCLEKIWQETDMFNPSPPSVASSIMRFRNAFEFKMKQTIKSREKKQIDRTKMFLSTLSLADSFRLLVELLKYDCFYLMASATPFQSNDDLHSIDHILRGIVPNYTTSASLTGNGNVNPDAIADASEYSTLFLEDVVKLLRNRGMFVSRGISLDSVECSVVRCPISPIQKFAMDEISAFFLQSKQLLGELLEIGSAMHSYIGSLKSPITEESVRILVERVNSGNMRGLNGVQKIDHRMHLTVLKPSDMSNGDTEMSLADILHTLLSKKKHNSSESLTFSKAATADGVIDEDEGYDSLFACQTDDSDNQTSHENNEKNNESVTSVFLDEEWSKKITQSKVRAAGNSVKVCKSALFAIKSRFVYETIKRLRRSNETKKAVMSLEETGDAFLNSLRLRIVEDYCPDGRNDGSRNKRMRVETKRYNILDVNPYDSSPLANAVLEGYNNLLVATAISTMLKIDTVDANTLYVMAVPRLPPPEPLMALSGNSIDKIEQAVGESKYAEITNRKLMSRISERGLMMLRNNRTSNPNKYINVFNNTKEVDVMLLGLKGSTGLSLHDSKTNKYNARRVHFMLDLPYNAVVFRQTIGRTHRNGQLTSPLYLIFSSDSPSEMRFFDGLDVRLKDSQAGSYADRYSTNTVSLSSAAELEQFLDKSLILRVMGMLIRIVTGDITSIDLFDLLSKVTVKIKNRGGYYAFYEGLDHTNGFFLDVISLGLNMCLVLIEKEDRIRETEDRERAKRLVQITDVSSMKSIPGAVGRIVFSNLCMKYFKDPLIKDPSTVLREFENRVLFTNKHESISPKMMRLVESAEVIAKEAMALAQTLLGNGGWSPTAVASIEDPMSDDGETEFDKTSFLLGILKHAPENMGRPLDELFTVRVLGGGRKQGVIPIEEVEVEKFVMSVDSSASVSTVAATSVISILCEEDPKLILKLVNTAAAHKRFTYPYCKSSYILRLAHRLSSGKMVYRQFQNEYFSAKKESELMSDLYISVRAVMARDERLEGLCRNRKNDIIKASYYEIRVPPSLSTRKRTKEVADKILLDYTEDDDIENSDSEERMEIINDYDIDILLYTGEKVTLIPKNSMFVEEHLDYFVLSHLFNEGERFVQIVFDNYEQFEGLPCFCLYDRSV